jgi:hypothetical protein
MKIYFIIIKKKLKVYKTINLLVVILSFNILKIFLFYLIINFFKIPSYWTTLLEKSKLTKILFH